MHNQPKYKPLAASVFFDDGRSARPVIEGTVARGHMRLDVARFTGKVNGQDVAEFPFPITRADLGRGQERYNIYCAPCHSRIGDGQGMIVKRGLKAAGNYHTDRLRNAPVGHFFDVITNGYGAMASYASRVPVDDRWRIIAYIRVLEYSQAASVNDVPADLRAAMDKAGAAGVQTNGQPYPMNMNEPQGLPPSDVPRPMPGGGVTRPEVSQPPTPAPPRNGFDTEGVKKQK